MSIHEREIAFPAASRAGGYGVRGSRILGTVTECNAPGVFHPVIARSQRIHDVDHLGRLEQTVQLADVTVGEVMVNPVPGKG